MDKTFEAMQLRDLDKGLVELAKHYAEAYGALEEADGIKGQGFKVSRGKVEWSQLPWRELEEVANVLTEGAADHGSDTNWQFVPDARKVYFNSMMRHIVAWQNGEINNDADHGRAHLAHAISNALFLMWGDNQEEEKC